MPIISRIGRRTVKVRLLIFGIFAILIAGAVTMVYPFLLMVSGSTKSAVDASETRVIPRFLVDDAALWAKHVEGLFSESLDMMRQVHNSDVPAFDQVEPPAEPNPALAQAWLDFLREKDPPHYTYTIGYVRASVSRGPAPHALRAFKKERIEQFDDDINALNRAMHTEFVGWNSFFILPEQHLKRRDKPLATELGLAFRDFKARQDTESRYYFTPEGFYREYLKTQYTRKIEAYNEKHGTEHASYREIHLDRRVPAGPDRTEKEREDWVEFVRTLLNLLWVRADPEAAVAYRHFLRAKYGDVDTLNHSYGTNYKDFDAVRLIEEPPDGGLALTDWGAFLQGWKDPDAVRTYHDFLKEKYRDIAALNRDYGTHHTSFDKVPLTREPPAGDLALVDWCAALAGWEDEESGFRHFHILPAEQIRVHSVDFMFRDHLREKHGTVDKANEALGTSYSDWLDVLPPQRDAHYLAFHRKKAALRWELATRNYVTVADYMVRHGRGILNTAIYCALAVLGALLVNPLAAYALSRYKPPSAYKVLLFLMLTMAFPPMVTQIPVFLMLRRFDLLNTFWALILPGLANGYSIFLLKGFFDSLPQELYESAALDGAGELRIFLQITMSLSKPILAVISLNAFTVAYSNFMFALLICQDRKMWTLMVWIYDLQQNSGQGVVCAALILAAIPTFLMFALCQNIIMRGIVVPVEK